MDIAENLTLGIVIGAALVDSINPCVFGVLIFLLAFLTKVFKSKSQMLIGGLLYSGVVYATYLLLGFGVLKVAVSVDIANAFYWVAASIAIIAGVLEIKDYFWYGKGFSLQMIPGASTRIKKYTQFVERTQKKHPAVGLLMAGLLGVFVVLVELPCTGAPYFAVLALLSKGSYATAVPYLLIYNFVFVVPLLIIILIAYFGRGGKLEAWRKEHRGLMRLVMGLFLIFLGLYMIHSLYPLF